jgi:hypothetical protein
LVFLSYSKKFTNPAISNFFKCFYILKLTLYLELLLWLLNYFYLSTFFCGGGELIQGLFHARQALYYRATPPAPLKLVSYFLLGKVDYWMSSISYDKFIKIFFGGIEVWLLGKCSHHLSHSVRPVLCWVFSNPSLQDLFAQGWLWIAILISASWVS